MLPKLTEETFVVDLIDRAETHEEWLTIVRFGLFTLFNDPAFLFKVISKEVRREAERKNEPPEWEGFEMIVDELGMQFNQGSLICKDRARIKS